MEMNLTQRKKGLLEKIPDIQKTLDTVDFLKKKKVRRCSFRVDFQSSDKIRLGVAEWEAEERG